MFSTKKIMLPTNSSIVSKNRYPSGSPSRASEDAQIWMEWKKQLTAYVAWVNSQLKKKPGAHLIEDLRHDVRDGTALIDLIEVIACEKLENVHKAPSTHSEMRENVEKVLQFMTGKKIKMHHITTREIVDGNLKAIMRLILALAAHYKPNSVRHSCQANRQNITGIAQGAAAALTEARRIATRAGHRHRRRRHREDPARLSERRVVGEGDCSLAEKDAILESKAELEGASDNSSPVSSHNTSPRASLYLSDPPSSMEGLLLAAGTIHKGGVMVTSCESDNAMGDSGYSEVCDTLKETHQMLFQLHELLLNGDTTDESKALSGESLEGANLKETVVILKARLLHSEEVVESLRLDLTKVKKDCMELQGTKAGLQQRLKDQEGNLSALKSEVMKLELEKEKLILEADVLKKHLSEKEKTLSDVKTSSVKQSEDRDKAAADLKRDLIKKDHAINLLQEKLGQIIKEDVVKSRPVKDDTSLAAESKVRDGQQHSAQDQTICFITECLRRILDAEKNPGTKASVLESIKVSILKDRSQGSNVGQHNLSIDGLEDTVIKLLDKLQANGFGTPSVSNAHLPKKEQSSSTTGKRAFNASQNWRPTGNREPTKVRAQSSSSTGSIGCSTSARGTLSGQQGSSKGRQIPPRASPGTVAVNKSALISSRTPRSQIPRPQGTRSKVPPTSTDAETSVTYYVGQSEAHLSCMIHKKLGEARLRDFKSLIEDSNLYHYFFKVVDPRSGTVKEELSNDDDILPGREGKIVAWLELENGTIS